MLRLIGYVLEMSCFGIYQFHLFFRFVYTHLELVCPFTVMLCKSPEFFFSPLPPWESVWEINFLRSCISHVTINRLARYRVPGCEELFLRIILKALAYCVFSSKCWEMQCCSDCNFFAWVHSLSLPPQYLLGSSLYVMFWNFADDVFYSGSSIVLGTLKFGKSSSSVLRNFLELFVDFP